VTEKKQGLFTRFSKSISSITGKPATFIFATAVVIVWAVTGPIFEYSDTWQLVINTGTSIATFLMVFLIQNTQNRDTIALQVKLDELIRAVGEARNEIIEIDDLDDKQLEEKRREMVDFAKESDNTIDKAQGIFERGPSEKGD